MALVVDVVLETCDSKQSSIIFSKLFEHAFEEIACDESTLIRVQLVKHVLEVAPKSVTEAHVPILFEKLCRPLLLNVLTEKFHPQLCHDTCELAWLCFKLTENLTAETMMTKWIEESEQHARRCHSIGDRSVSSFRISIEMVIFAVDQITAENIEERLAVNMTNLQRISEFFLDIGDLTLISIVLSELFPKLLNLGNTMKLALSAMLWRQAKKYSTSGQETIGLMLLCNFMHWAAPNIFNYESIDREQLCSILQLGLTHDDSFCRKQAQFVLKLIGNFESLMQFVFGGDELMWSNCVLIAETLEETQITVIKPVLSKIVGLLEEGPSSRTDLLKTSWVITILNRMFQHETKFIRKWAVLASLKLTLTENELRFPRINDFIFKHLLKAINDSSLFARSKHESRGEIPEIATSISDFLFHCTVSLSDLNFCEAFHYRLMVSIQSINWAPAPFFYLSRALANLPNIAVWNLDTLYKLRQLLIDSLRNQDKLFKVVIQSFLFEAFLKLMNVTHLSLETFSTFLLIMPRNESLRRGSKLWRQCVTWFKRLIHANIYSASDVFTYCIELVGELIKVSETDEAIICQTLAERAARMLLLFVDAGVLLVFPSELKPSVQVAFVGITDILNSMENRPYLPINTILCSLQFILAVLEEIQFFSKECGSCADENDHDLRDWLERIMPLVINYIIQRLSIGFSTWEDFDQMQLYFRLLFIWENVYSDIQLLKSCFQKLVPVTIKQLCHYHIEKSSESLLRKFFVVKSLSWIVKSLQSEKLISFDFAANFGRDIFQILHIFTEKRTLTDPFEKWIINRNNKEVDRMICNSWGRLVSEYYCCIWDCVFFYCMKATSSLDLIHLTEVATLTIHLGTDVITSISPTLKLILPQVCEKDKTLFTRVLDLVWNTCFERRKTEAFWLSISCFIEISFQPSILHHPNAVAVLQQYCELAYDLSETCPSVFSMIVLHFKNLCQSESYPSFLRHYIKLIGQGLLFGFVHRKDQRVAYETLRYISSLGCFSAFENKFKNDYSDAVSVRAAAVTLLLCLIKTDTLLMKLATYLLEVEEEISKGKNRYYLNSLIHLKKNRVWQSLLIMEPLMNEEIAAEIFKTSCNELMKEGAQISVRLFQEWIIIRIVVRYEKLRHMIWDIIAKASKVRIGSVASFLVIVMHVGKLVDSFHRKSFLSTALPNLIPWCMTQNQKTRITAQIVFRELWSICETHNLQEILSSYRCLDTCLDVINSSKSTQKSENNFYFKIFNVMDISHFSLEAIFYDIPRLTYLTDTEWISVKIFSAFIKEKVDWIRIFNDDDKLSRFKWDNENDNDFIDDFDKKITVTNVQKKITPWKEAFSERFSCSKRTSHSKKLILVASLIERLPNLGGLCRSCEIFGASEFVLSSTKYIQEKQFQNLSVSAEKWLKITEVKIHQLQDYLLSMKKDGFTLIGVEQTAKSVALNTYKFPNKCVLLLGNEKEGIPVLLIQLLDVCLEIPQIGVIRSLNVHVSGALIMWEYAKQSIFHDNF